MKKLFTEPEVEILTFLCSDTPAADSVETGGSGDAGELPLIPKN